MRPTSAAVPPDMHLVCNECSNHPLLGYPLPRCSHHTSSDSGGLPSNRGVKICVRIHLQYTPSRGLIVILWHLMGNVDRRHVLRP
ncbi:hypothetical protein AVEN_10363-1 [Araneus ventricosus]|uniref:Uncharacterized protein n=1 Tax=Araneus ventricosus TaxID=182803 RepID=A0A4Y2VV54_ARAVE|nr:hypothetical protein AVEN_10363-1 [Araneus ventricosus]